MPARGSSPGSAFPTRRRGGVVQSLLGVGGYRVNLGHHRTALEAALAHARYLGPAESKTAADHAESGAREHYKRQRSS